MLNFLSGKEHTVEETLTRDSAKAGPPRTTSSANSSTAQSATPKALPSPVEMGSTTEEMRSETCASARRMRSTTAAACGGK